MAQRTKRTTFTSRGSEENCRRFDLDGWGRTDNQELKVGLHTAVLRFLEAMDPADVYAVLEERKVNTYEGVETRTTTVYWREKEDG